MTRVVGVDLGGTGLRAGMLSEAGEISALKSLQHGGFPRPLDAVERIAEAVEAVSGGKAVDAVGVGVAAWVERPTGHIRRAPNLGWVDVPFRELLSRRLGAPVVTVHNDLKAIAWGEWRFGAGAGAESLLVVYLGTGVGAATVSDGVLQLGARGFGGEIGHILVGRDDGPACGCGRRGCLESYVGGAAFARRAELLRVAGRLGGLVQHEVTVDALELLARTDDDARRLLEEGGEILGRTIGGVVTFLNPDVVLLGGGSWDASGYVRDAVRLGIDVAVHPDLRKSVRFVDASLGASAGVMGAADLARRALTSQG